MDLAEVVTDTKIEWGEKVEGIGTEFGMRSILEMHGI